MLNVQSLIAYSKFNYHFFGGLASKLPVCEILLTFDILWCSLYSHARWAIREQQQL